MRIIRIGLYDFIMLIFFYLILQLLLLKSCMTIKVTLTYTIQASMKKQSQWSIQDILKYLLLIKQIFYLCGSDIDFKRQITFHINTHNNRSI